MYLCARRGDPMWSPARASHANMMSCRTTLCSTVGAAALGGPSTRAARGLESGACAIRKVRAAEGGGPYKWS